MKRIEFESKERIKKNEEIIKNVLTVLGFISILTTLGIIFLFWRKPFCFLKGCL